MSIDPKLKKELEQDAMWAGISAIGAVIVWYALGWALFGVDAEQWVGGLF